MLAGLVITRGLVPCFELEQCDALLEAINEVAVKEDKDRLELLTAIVLSLNALTRSVQGWMSWIRNWPFMAKFTEEELTQIEDGLRTSTIAFIEHDIEVTKRHGAKIPQTKYRKAERRKKGETRGLYA